MITGTTLQAWGFKPDKWFKAGIETANRLQSEGESEETIRAALAAMAPVEMGLRTNDLPFSVMLDAGTPEERDNLAAVVAHMDALMRTPTIVAGAVMPDACPAGQQMGTIPVGGVVACEDAIHPGFHSADICCSVAVTVFKRGDEPRKLLDAVQEVTHFGPGGRPGILKTEALTRLMPSVSANPFLKGLENFGLGHFGSQGDGNHFAYVGCLKSTGALALVTHHGSRGLGAQLYKRGMAAARKHTAVHAPKVPAHNAWVQAGSREGEAYWDALQIAREWTRESHYAIHDLAARKLGNRIDDRFWNEHNFVFQRSDGRFYHGKGATPSWAGFSPDDDGRTLIPLNMSEPILIARHRDRADALGFAPHGAGRNMSRKQHLRVHGANQAGELAALGARGLDIRSFCGKPDLSELPSAYKDATAVREQIDRYGLAEIIDEILPYGSIMAGEWKADAPWRKGKKGTNAKRAARFQR